MFLEDIYLLRILVEFKWNSYGFVSQWWNFLWAYTEYPQLFHFFASAKGE